jgi:PEP-CTERM motif-containing protein
MRQLATMKKIAIASIAAAAAASLGSAAGAAVSVTATPGCAVYCGPTPITYDFDTTFPITLGGGIVGPGTTPGSFAQPLGSTGQYFSVGPSTSTPANVTIGDNIASFSFIWGSVDTYNSLQLNTMAGSYLFTGTDIAALIPGFADGNQTSPTSNPIVTFFLTGDDQIAVNFNMLSEINAFEIDNIAVNPVPEPATWAMMLLGFGAIGFTMRKARRATAMPQIA